MRDFARYVILSPVMSATAAPAMQRTIPLDPGGVSFCEPGNFDPKDFTGFDGKPSPSKGAPLGTVVRRPHVVS